MKGTGREPQGQMPCSLLAFSIYQTQGLVDANQALYQLSYRPGFRL